MVQDINQFRAVPHKVQNFGTAKCDMYLKAAPQN